MLLSIMMLFILVDLHAQVAKKRACIGNSITYGARLKERSIQSYPALLQQILGDGYQVKYFGLSGRTMTTSGRGYLKEVGWKKVLQFKPDIVTIALGTNYPMGFFMSML